MAATGHGGGIAARLGLCACSMLSRVCSRMRHVQLICMDIAATVLQGVPLGTSPARQCVYWSLHHKEARNL